MVADRYSYAKWKARKLVQFVDGIFMDSAQRYGQKRLVRWVMNKKCRPTVKHIIVENGAFLDFTTFQEAMWNAGLNNLNRKYVVFADVNGSGQCAVSSFWNDNNMARSYTGWAKLNSWCWTGHHFTHELGHLLGAVVTWAPNATMNYHCTDGQDIMCYSDGPGVVMRYPCGLPMLLDCNGDDYFNPAPVAGTWLAANSGSNIAMSPYLDRRGFARWKLRK